MFKLNSMRTQEFRSNVRGGNGSPEFSHIFSSDELGSRIQLAAVVTLKPGESIGVHPHTENGELYSILEGTAVVTEDEVLCTLHPGDSEFCADGHTHSISNQSDSDVRFLAVIVPDR